VISRKSEVIGQIWRPEHSGRWITKEKYRLTLIATKFHSDIFDALAHEWQEPELKNEVTAKSKV